MLSLSYNNYIFLSPFILIYIIFWIFFIKNNFLTVRINPKSKDILKNSNFLKKTHYLLIINWFSVNFFILFIFFYFIKIDFNVFWFNHLKINNFIINLILIIFLLSFIFINTVKFLKNSNVNYNLDYFFSLINLICFITLMFLSNNVYSFLFFLEINSLLILYKFSVSRNWFNNYKFINKNTFSKILSKSYLNMIFFQYWTNFFSSMLIMFSVFSIIFFFGSTEWFLINLLNYNNFYFNNNYIFMYIWISFLIGLFFKIGFTPLHLFKIEVYKGIPFISIFFYTTLYFLSFFFYFVIILYYNIYNINFIFNKIIYLFLFIGMFYTLILLFDVNLLKSFFAYSTVVNVLNFFIVLYLIIN